MACRWIETRHDAHDDSGNRCMSASWEIRFIKLCHDTKSIPTKVYRYFSKLLKSREIFGMKPNNFSLNLWNITYLNPTVRIQCSKTMSHISTFGCRSRSGVGKICKCTISMTYWIGNKASLFVFKDMKYVFFVRKRWAIFQIYCLQFGPESRILQAHWKQAMSQWHNGDDLFWRFRSDTSKVLVHCDDFTMQLCLCWNKTLLASDRIRKYSIMSIVSWRVLKALGKVRYLGPN